MEIKYYKDETEDFTYSHKQDYKLKNNYKWIHNNVFYRFIANIVYFIFIIVSLVYCKLILKVRVIGKEKLKGHKGYFVYSNHTQKLMDPLFPIIANLPRKTSYIVSPANLGIPVLGKLLPMCGALPIPTEIKRILKLNEAIKHYSSKNNAIMIYPEAHLWEYYTGIREFPNTSFHYPVELKKEVFVFTTTYQKSKKEKPKITIYIDGPIYINENLSKREKIKDIHDKVYQTMKERSTKSNYDYILYKKIDS